MTTDTAYRWDDLEASAIASMLGVGTVELLEEVDSTLDVAHERAAAGARSNVLIVADAQHAGRGRLGRSWSSAPRRGVWCTMVERPDPRAVDVLSLRVGLSIAERLDALAGERVGVKWPNDLVIGAGKLGGILVEARWAGDQLSWVAIGVGINVIPPADVPTAAGMLAGVRRIDVLRQVVEGVRAAVSLRGPLSETELLRFQRRDILFGRRLASPGVGAGAGITPDGALMIRTAGGSEQHRAGTVEFAEGA